MPRPRSRAPGRGASGRAASITCKAWQIGPTVAQDPGAGRRLLAAAMASLAGEDLLIDIIADSPTAAELKRLGFHPLRSLTRMFLGPNRHPGRPAMSTTIGAFEKG